MKLKSYADASQGKMFLLPVSVNGSAPVTVLVDTGSVGLRIFKSALGTTTVPVSTKAVSANFGGNVMKGHLAKVAVTLGDGDAHVATNAATPIQVVEQLACDATFPQCDVASGKPDSYTRSGIFGILGVGTRSDPDGLVNPVAMLAPPLASGYSIATNGLDDEGAVLTVGIHPANTAGAGAPIQLARAGALPNGAPAWADDAIRLCYSLNGSPTDPACTDSAFDTGSNLDVLYAKRVRAPIVTEDGQLAPGVRFEVKHTSGFDLKFTVGAQATTSWDGVLVESDEPFALVGIEVFIRHRAVTYDLAAGRILFQPRP
jgi:hypothetical protein